MLHAAAPNACGSVRKHLYLAYGPRWMRPSGYNNHSPELLVRTQTISKRRTPTGPGLRWLGPCFGFCRRHRRRSDVSCSVRWAIYQIRWGITPTAAPTPDTGTPLPSNCFLPRDRNLNWVCSSQVCGFGRTGSAQGLGRGARGRQLCAALAGFGVGALPQRKRCRAWHGREVRQRQPELQLVQATQDFSAQKDSDAALV